MVYRVYRPYRYNGRKNICQEYRTLIKFLLQRSCLYRYIIGIKANTGNAYTGIYHYFTVARIYYGILVYLQYIIEMNCHAGFWGEV